jgi:hypothetical protein
MIMQVNADQDFYYLENKINESAGRENREKSNEKNLQSSMPDFANGIFFLIYDHRPRMDCIIYKINSTAGTVRTFLYSQYLCRDVRDDTK